MKVSTIGFIVVLSASSIVGAHAEPIGLDPIFVGMSFDKMTKDPNLYLQCKLQGMLYKYKVCKQKEDIMNIPVYAEYYFDNEVLVMADILFQSKNLPAIILELRNKYGNELKDNINSNVIRWVKPEGDIEITLFEERPHIAELKILDPKALDKRKQFLLSQ